MIEISLAHVRACQGMQRCQSPERTTERENGWSLQAEKKEEE
jgi:hypothetical protein